MGELDLITPWSAQLSLDEVVDRLSASDRVEAVSFLGSTGTGDWSDASDYDLCLLVHDYPPRFGVEATIVDGRIGDIVIVDVDYASNLAHPVLSPGDKTADGVADGERPFVRWLAQSRPVFDPGGVAGRAREAAVALTVTEPPVTQSWQQITRSFVTHDLRVNAALLRRTDSPVVRAALGMRQLHTFVSAVQAWFTARGLRQGGWKKDMATIAGADPAMFCLIERWLLTSDLEARHEIFGDAVERSLEPIGGPLPAGTLLQQPDDIFETLDPSDRPG